MLPRVEIIQCDPEVPSGVFEILLQEWQVPVRTLRADLGASMPCPANAAIVLGGTMGVHDEDQYPWLRPLKEFIRQMVAGRIPLLGICLGGQLLAEACSGTVYGNRCGERGLVDIWLTDAGAADPLFVSVGRRFQAFQWHNDSFSIPPGAELLAFSTVCNGQAFRIGNAWGLQFHPEVDAAIVAGWVANNPIHAALMDTFARAEAVHHVLARRMLGNFLAVAGVRRC